MPGRQPEGPSLLGAFSVVRAKPFRVLSKNHVWCARRLPYPCGGRGISPLVVSDDCLHVATAVTSVLAHWQSHRGTRLKSSFGSIAQLGEHLPYKQRVSGSSPFVPTNVRIGSTTASIPAFQAGDAGSIPVRCSSRVSDHFSSSFLFLLTHIPGDWRYRGRYNRHQSAFLFSSRSAHLEFGTDGELLGSHWPSMQVVR